MDITKHVQNFELVRKDFKSCEILNDFAVVNTTLCFTAKWSACYVSVSSSRTSSVPSLLSGG